MGDDSIPVTVLSGTLGAGKTTTLNHVLQETDRELAVLVNDMGEVNVDADRVAESSDIADEDEELIELSNGCICCELRGNLLDAIGELTASDREFDAVVVESTGVAEPLPVAQTLTLGFDQSDLDPTEFYEETGIEPLEGCHLDTTVTVVDAHQFHEAMNSDDVLDDDGTKKHLGDLLVEQVEFCDVLLLNKCDLVDEETLAEIESTVSTLQPRADIVRTENGRIDPDELIDTDRFDFEEASQSAGWMQELQQPHESAEEEHGVTSFVFEARRPFHPERFAELLDEFPDDIVRSKGHFWIASRESAAITLNVAGQSVRVAPAGTWFDALPADERERQLEENPELEEIWHDRWGDRNVRLVLIGVEIDHDALRRDLADCLLTDEELEAEWSTYEDRFPTFELPEEDDESAEETDADSQEEIGLAD
ncbi:GTP-binding protein [Natronobacterium gregoryi]|uniref:Cobalamin synthesis protein P47K n=2 Tax=Natronobacterium gregoryi TaxID=44930 RepID=L0AGV3_NATGS|nr:GTP-binding protein [Natronobacterium gregoryi]AFZ72320.1 putative GTPase, G3E family [Natronobacterium gregoryi SP2]ELY71739.1 cobalamin synthesis protein P47K [Natronobacterium gregoryi SP2]PLK18315.1 GTP-binding protein [Natronobacterium gregoryi SP2]SFJ72093.1 GTPase, G3E family [Natronobacterium gregoryi]